eukprot:1705847-Pyramimonas_sp.AAC.1
MGPPGDILEAVLNHLGQDGAILEARRGHPESWTLYPPAAGSVQAPGHGARGRCKPLPGGGEG